MRIPIASALPGDILVFRRDPKSLLSGILSWLIQKFHSPDWNRWEWHMGFYIGNAQYIDAQFPKVKISPVPMDDTLVHAYRITGIYYEHTTKRMIRECVGKWYDPIVYIWTALRILNCPVPRIINRFLDCWEVAFKGIDYETPLNDYHYPFITDFLRMQRELK